MKNISYIAMYVNNKNEDIYVLFPFFCLIGKVVSNFAAAFFVFKMTLQLCVVSVMRSPICQCLLVVTQPLDPGRSSLGSVLVLLCYPTFCRLLTLSDHSQF